MMMVVVVLLVSSGSARSASALSHIQQHFFFFFYLSIFSFSCFVGSFKSSTLTDPPHPPSLPPTACTPVPPHTAAHIIF